MLIVWNTLLVPDQQDYIHSIDSRAAYWPRSWQFNLTYNRSEISEWWISFSRSQRGLLWVLKYPEYSRVIYFD